MNLSACRKSQAGTSGLPVGSKAVARRRPAEATGITGWCATAVVACGVIDPDWSQLEGVELPSAFGKSSKVTLGLPIPPHAFDGVLPPALHLLQGTFVRRVTLSDHLLEMTILRLDDLVCGHALVRRIARATQLLTRHGLHDPRFLSLCRTVTWIPTWSVRINLSGLHPNTDYVHGRQHVWVGD